MSPLLVAFVACRFAQYLFEKYLGRLNFAYYHNAQVQQQTVAALNLSQDDLRKSIAYADDRYKFGVFSGWVKISVFMAFLVAGGFGYVETYSTDFSIRHFDGSGLATGLAFFGILGGLSILLSIPFSYYSTFVIEERHGFNRQTKLGFLSDLLKMLVLSTLLGGFILALLLWIIDSLGANWWLWAWIALSGFSLLTAYIYPSLLAPLFNKFSPLPDGELKSKILELAGKLSFRTNGIFIMDASKRSSHGNAYFTGLFGEKRIVLFDTLLESLTPDQTLAVLAHELGHFKLHHVRWSLIRSVLTTGITFFIMGQLFSFEDLYHAFHPSGVSSYGALIVFSMWFGLVDFILHPTETLISRRNEFAADSFAKEYVPAKYLGEALLKLREKSHSLPMAHPWYSAYYYSHPPMLERLKAMGFQARSV